MSCNPPYNTRHVTELPSLEHDRQCMLDMSHFVELFSVLKNLRAHGPTLNFALLLKIWHDLLFRDLEEVVKDRKALESKEPANQMKNVSEVETKLLHYVWAPGIDRRDSRVKHLQHIYIAKCATHFYRLGLPA